MTLRSLNPLAIQNWNTRFVPTAPDAFFLTREWAAVLHETYGFDPCYLTDDTDDTSAAPLMLPLMAIRSWLTGRRGVSLPFSDYCPGAGLTPATADPLLAALRALGAQRRWRHFELRSAAGFPSDTPCFARYWRHDLDLTPGEKPLFDQLHGTCRTAIRKAVKSGVTVSFATTLEAVRDFYRLNCQTRRAHGLPPQPFRFFVNLHRLILAPGLGVVALAHCEGRPVAASIFGLYGQQALYKYGASDKQTQELRAPNLIMWEAIRRFASQGFRQLAMGRTALSHDGLRRYKLGWGTLESEVRYLRYDLRAGQFTTPATPDLESGYSLFRYLPLPLSRLAGALLYRHVA